MFKFWILIGKIFVVYCFLVFLVMELIGKQGRHTVFFLLKFAWWSYNCKYGQAHDTGLVSTTRLDIFVNALQL